jgi:hypothetical protein
LSLTHTARNRRTLGNIHAILVLVDADRELHAALILNELASTRGRIRQQTANMEL